MLLASKLQEAGPKQAVHTEVSTWYHVSNWYVSYSGGGHVRIQQSGSITA